jgi:hypothetical protein
MTRNWHANPPKSRHEFEAMAVVLEARHGRLAAEVADFFASMHIDEGDERRSIAWADVAELVRERERSRLLHDR